MRVRVGPVCLTVALTLALTAPARPAQAQVIESAIGDAVNGILKELALFFVVIPAVIGSDLAFSIHDSIAARDLPPARLGWSVAETVITTPQMLFFSWGLVELQGKQRWEDPADQDASEASVLVPAVWTSAMTVHGIWGLASPRSDPPVLYGGSWAVGANLAFTVEAVSAAFGDRRLPGKAAGIVEMIGTTPSIAVSAAQLADPTARWKPAWATLTVWSSALFLHGVASTIKGFRDLPKPTPKETKETKEQASSARRFRLYMAPMLSGNGKSETRGLVVGGVF